MNACYKVETFSVPEIQYECINTSSTIRITTFLDIFSTIESDRLSARNANFDRFTPRYFCYEVETFMVCAKKHSEYF